MAGYVVQLPVSPMGVFVRGALANAFSSDPLDALERRLSTC